MKRIFEATILTELFPQSIIDIYVQVLQSDGGKPWRQDQNYFFAKLYNIMLVSSLNDQKVNLFHSLV